MLRCDWILVNTCWLQEFCSRNSPILCCSSSVHGSGRSVILFFVLHCYRCWCLSRSFWIALLIAY